MLNKINYLFIFIKTLPYMSKHTAIPNSCPCNSNNSYLTCCQPYHTDITKPNTAEQLMRSRYSAYVLKLENYIQKTWHATTRPNNISNEQVPVKWIALIIKQTKLSEHPNEAFVEFEARYKINGKAEKMHEVSRFIYENGEWFYIDGEVS